MLMKLVIVYAITTPSNSRAVFPVTTWLCFPLGLDAHATQETPDPEDDTSIHIHI